MATKKTLYMETTEVEASRSAAEITAVLVAAGATQIATDYHDGKITGLRWSMNINGRSALFDMPARVDPVYRLLIKRRGWSNPYRADGKPVDPKVFSQAERVAWRQLLRWTQAQIAMVDTGMVQAAEVFFAYMVDASSGQTLFSHVMETTFKALPPPEKPQ